MYILPIVLPIVLPIILPIELPIGLPIVYNQAKPNQTEPSLRKSSEVQSPQRRLKLGSATGSWAWVGMTQWHRQHSRQYNRQHNGQYNRQLYKHMTFQKVTFLN